MPQSELDQFLHELKNSKFKKIGIIAIVIIIFLIFLNPFVIIGAGERGVLLSFGAVQDNILDEGLHFRIPFVEKVINLDVKLQKSQTDSDAATNDLQDVKFSIVVNYHIAPDKVNVLYQKIGIYFQDRVINPSVEEGVKAIAAKYTAEELITQRDKVSLEIKELLKKKLHEYNITVDAFSIVSFLFSTQFTQAIEEKQTAEQKALKAERDLDRIKIEAKQKVVQAQAEATALRLQKAQVTPQLVKLREIEVQIKAIEKWDGTLPRVTSGAIPFINVNGTK